MGCPSKEEDIKIKKRPRVSTDCFTNIYMFINQVSTVTFDNYNTNGTEKIELFVRISKLKIQPNQA